MLTDDDVKILKKVIVKPLEKRLVSIENKLDNITVRLDSWLGEFSKSALKITP